MIKILQINTTYNNGGAAQIARTLYKKLHENSRFLSYFAYGRGDKIEGGNIFKFSLKPEVYLHGALTRVIGLEGYGTTLSTYRLISFIKKNNFNLIHLHNIHGYFLNFNFINFLKEEKIPIVWTLHDGWPLTGSCAYLSECNYWQHGCEKCPNKFLYPKNYINLSNVMWKRKNKLFKEGWNPIIITPSQWLLNKVEKSILKEHEVKVINNGIDVNLFKPRDKLDVRKKLNIPLDKKVILFVAANLDDKRKGVKFFFDALQYINTDDWMVVTIGKKFKEELSIKAEINQLGYIFDRKLLSEVYSTADVFCTTSLDEVFGLTVTESMACGTPVVGFDVGGIPEQVADNCGFIVPPKDTKALAKKLEKLLIDDDLRKKYSNKCRERVVNKYSIEKMSENYIKLYKQIMGEG